MLLEHYCFHYISLFLLCATLMDLFCPCLCRVLVKLLNIFHTFLALSMLTRMSSLSHRINSKEQLLCKMFRFMGFKAHFYLLCLITCHICSLLNPPLKSYETEFNILNDNFTKICLFNMPRRQFPIFESCISYHLIEDIVYQRKF